MFHRWNQQSLKCRCSPSTIRTVVLQHTAVFLLLSLYQGQAAIIGSSKPIIAMIGQDVILPCRLVPSANVAGETLEWSRPDLNPRYVHVRRDGVELLLNQNPLYVGRTSVSINNLKRGDMSLTISGVRPSDEGTYRCLVPAKGTAEVKVLVGAVSSPVITIEDITTKTAALQCEAKGWSPEPELLWLDNKGNNLTAERTRPEKDAGGLYRTSSRVSVETKKEQVFTCRVQQKNIHQTREAHVHIQGHACVPPSFCAACVAMVISVVVLLLSVVSVGFIILWRRRQKKTNDDEDPYATVKGAAEEKGKLGEERTSLKNDDGLALSIRRQRETITDDTENIYADIDHTAEEEEKLADGSKDKKNQDEKSLQDKQKEKDFSRVISILEEQREDLKKSRDKLKSKVDKARKNLVVYGRMQPDNGEIKNDKDAIEKWSIVKVRLEEKLKTHSDSHRHVEERLKKTADLILKLTEKKVKLEHPAERTVSVKEKSHYNWNKLKKKKNHEGESEKTKNDFNKSGSEHGD